ncbi:MAG: hypothetical protein MRY76_12510, partial [Pseudomonadales bacterium]|nr:hypothetical protein [Pseudomonadales bacterium]
MPRAILFLILCTLGLASKVALAQDASVERGRVLFQNECSRCHVPIEMDARLRARWVGRTGQELYEQIRSTMPAETPGS